MEQWIVQPGTTDKIPGPIYGLRFLSGSSPTIQLGDGEAREVYARGAMKPVPGQPWPYVQVTANTLTNRPTKYLGILPWYDAPCVLEVSTSPGEDLDAPIAPLLPFVLGGFFGTSWVAGSAGGTPAAGVTGDGVNTPYTPVAPFRRILSTSVGGFIRLRHRDPDLGTTGTTPRVVMLWEGKILGGGSPSIIWTPAAGGPITLTPYVSGVSPVGNGAQDFLISNPADAITLTPIDNIAAAGIGLTPTFIDITLVAPAR